jgi:hypothetical protein
LQAPCQIPLDRLAPLGRPIRHSLRYDIHIDVICLTYDTSLLLKLSI